MCKNEMCSLCSTDYSYKLKAVCHLAKTLWQMFRVVAIGHKRSALPQRGSMEERVTIEMRLGNLKLTDLDVM